MDSFGFGCLSLFELVLVVLIFFIVFFFFVDCVGLCWFQVVQGCFCVPWLLRGCTRATFSSCKVVFGSFFFSKNVFMCIFCREVSSIGSRPGMTSFSLQQKHRSRGLKMENEGRHLLELVPGTIYSHQAHL